MAFFIFFPTSAPALSITGNCICCCLHVFTKMKLLCKMYYFKKLSENYYIYIILVFIFIPINFIPQLFDGVMFSYIYEIGDFSPLKLWYTQNGKQIHLLVLYIIDFFVKHTFLPAEIFFDGIAVIFLILLCFEVKIYSKYAYLYLGMYHYSGFQIIQYK